MPLAGGDHDNARPAAFNADPTPASRRGCPAGGVAADSAYFTLWGYPIVGVDADSASVARWADSAGCKRAASAHRVPAVPTAAAVGRSACILGHARFSAQNFDYPQCLLYASGLLG